MPASDFPNLYSVTDSFKKYVEITLVAKETQGNIAAKKLTIQTDAREFPDSVAITPGSYLLNAKFISMKNNQPKVLAKSDDNMLLELKAGQEKKFKILLRD